MGTLEADQLYKPTAVLLPPTLVRVKVLASSYVMYEPGPGVSSLRRLAALFLEFIGNA
jgi:hypothetical protein